MKMLRLKCPECHRGGGAHEFPYPPVAARTRGFDDRGAHGRRMPPARCSRRPRRQHSAFSARQPGQATARTRILPRVVILIPEGGEQLRDTLVINIGDERCRWQCPRRAETFPASSLAPSACGQTRWPDCATIPEPGALKVYETGFAKLDSYGLRIVTPAFMPIVGPYGSGKSIFLRQLLINLWRLHGWKFALTSFEEKVRPRFERDLSRHLIA